jgi:NADPH:quinone reductase-like Zn-dependent oxidoreductase
LGAIPVTVSTQREVLEPLIGIIGAVPLRELSVATVRSALKELAATRATRTVARTHAGLTRAIRYAEAGVPAQVLLLGNEDVVGVVDTVGGVVPAGELGDVRLGDLFARYGGTPGQAGSSARSSHHARRRRRSRRSCRLLGVRSHGS